MVQIDPIADALSEEPSLSAVSWAAILAGAVAAFSLSLVLFAFGAGMGFSAVSPWAGAGITAKGFGVAAGIYLVVVAMLASTIGGFLAGGSRSKWVNLHTDEVFFRDTAHGFLSWALATTLTVLLLALGTANVAGRAVAGLPVATSAANQSGNSIEGFLDSLLRLSPAANRPPADASVRDEAGRLLATAIRGKNPQPADRTYLAQLVAMRTGLNQADAEKRVDEVIVDTKSALDDARSAAAKFFLWSAAAMLVGAFAASLAATEGGQQRDGTWKWNR